MLGLALSQMLGQNKCIFSDFLRKFENQTLKEKFSVYVKDDPNNVYQKETLHYRDNVRIAPVVVTAKEIGVVMAKDRASMMNMTSIGKLSSFTTCPK